MLLLAQLGDGAAEGHLAHIVSLLPGRQHVGTGGHRLARGDGGLDRPDGVDRGGRSRDPFTDLK